MPEKRKSPTPAPTETPAAPVSAEASGACPHCGGTSKFGGTVVWCQCSGWLDR